MTRARRALVLLLSLGSLLLLMAGPASAHGVPTAGPPNWVSTVTSAPGDGLAWSVVGVDAALRLDNQSGREVLVRGYAGEPYLRIGPDGVFENVRSTTRWLNLNRFGDLTTIKVPSDVGAEQPPSWTRVADGPTWTWFDHRIHWIQINRLPPVVMSGPDVRQVVREWTVPAELGGEQVGPSGELLWLPSPLPAFGPWLLVGAAAALLALGALVTRRWRSGAVAVTLAGLLLAVIGAWYEVGSVIELGNVVPGGSVLTAALRTTALVIGAVAAVVLVAQRHPWARWVLLASTLAVAASVGLRELEVLNLPVARGPLPTPLTRALVIASLALPAAAVATLILPGPDNDEA